MSPRERTKTSTNTTHPGGAYLSLHEELPEFGITPSNCLLTSLRLLSR